MGKQIEVAAGGEKIFIDGQANVFFLLWSQGIICACQWTQHRTPNNLGPPVRDGRLNKYQLPSDGYRESTVYQNILMYYNKCKTTTN